MDFEDTDVTWPLGKSVIRGEIDNTSRKRTRGKVWLKGREEPLELDLHGDCMRDIAGCRLKFTNISPVDGDDIDLACLQTGLIGEMTASRKIKYFEKGPEQSSGRTGTCIYLEWFSDVNGRVLLEGPDFQVEIVESAWYMSPEDERSQIEVVASNLERWEREMSDYDCSDYEPRRMNEFEWELNLRESDALTARFSRVLEKYLDHPNCDKLIAREMGWTWLLESEGEKDEKGSCTALDMEEDMMGEFDEEDDFEFAPNPLTEGVDWIKGRNGRVTHPLTNRSFSMAMELWSYCKESGNLSENADQDLRDMIFQVQTLTAKLAGALDGLAYDAEADGGFVVACLKRSLPYINKALASSDSVSRKQLIEDDKLLYFRRRMLEVREEIIRLMSRFRKEVD